MLINHAYLAIILIVLTNFAGFLLYQSSHTFHAGALHGLHTVLREKVSAKLLCLERPVACEQR